MLTERAAKPGRQGDGKALLGPVQDFSRHQPLEGALEDDLALASALAAGERKTQGPVDEAMVEHRYAHFQAARHRGAIDLGQNIARQPCLRSTYCARVTGS